MEPHSRRKSSVKGQCRWKIEHTLTAMLVDGLIKHISDQTVLENLIKNNVYSLREASHLEEIRSKAVADKKEMPRAKPRPRHRLHF